jgi:hypothetical protein
MRPFDSTATVEKDEVCRFYSDLTALGEGLCPSPAGGPARHLGPEPEKPADALKPSQSPRCDTTPPSARGPVFAAPSLSEFHDHIRSQCFQD